MYIFLNAIIHTLRKKIQNCINATKQHLCKNDDGKYWQKRFFVLCFVYLRILSVTAYLTGCTILHVSKILEHHSLNSKHNFW